MAKTIFFGVLITFFSVVCKAQGNVSFKPVINPGPAYPIATDMKLPPRFPAPRYDHKWPKIAPSTDAGLESKPISQTNSYFYRKLMENRYWNRGEKK